MPGELLEPAVAQSYKQVQQIFSFPERRASAVP